MDAFVEQLVGNRAFIKMQNGEMKEVLKKDLPKGIKVDDLLAYEDGRFIRDPKSQSKKEAMAKELEELMKKTFTPVTTYTDEHPKK